MQTKNHEKDMKQSNSGSHQTSSSTRSNGHQKKDNDNSSKADQRLGARNDESRGEDEGRGKK